MNPLLLIVFLSGVLYFLVLFHVQFIKAPDVDIPSDQKQCHWFVGHLYVLLSAMKAKSLHKLLLKWHNRFGSAVMFYTPGEVFVSVTEPEFVSHVFTNTDKFPLPKRVMTAMLPLTQSCAVMYGAMHKDRRALVSHVMRPSKLVDLTLSGTNRAYDMCLQGLLSGGSGGERVGADIAGAVDQAVSTALLHVAFGEAQLVSKRGDALRSVPRLAEEAFAHTYKSIVHFETAFEKMTGKKQTNASLEDLLSKMSSIVSDVAREEEAAKNKSKSVVQMLCDTHPSGASLSPEEVTEETLMFFLGSKQAISASLCWAIQMVAQNEDVLNTLLKELERDDFTVDPSKATYLQKVVKETLRLYPPVPVLTRMCVKEAEVNGMLIPRRSNIVIPVVAIHRNGLVYTEPDKFSPSRWDKLTKLEPGTYVPFGLGEKCCVGERLSMIVLQVLLARFVRQYQCTLSAGHESVSELRAGTLQLKHGLRVDLSPR